MDVDKAAARTTVVTLAPHLFAPSSKVAEFFGNIFWFVFLTLFIGFFAFLVAGSIYFLIAFVFDLRENTTHPYLVFGLYIPTAFAVCYIAFRKTFLSLPTRTDIDGRLLLGIPFEHIQRICLMKEAHHALRHHGNEFTHATYKITIERHTPRVGKRPIISERTLVDFGPTYELDNFQRAHDFGTALAALMDMRLQSNRPYYVSPSIAAQWLPHSTTL